MSNSLLVPHDWTSVDTPIRETALYLYDNADAMPQEHVHGLIKALTPVFQQFNRERIIRESVGRVPNP